MNSDIENRLIWLGGKIVNVNDAKINVLSPTSQFGLNVFEGIRCYWNGDKQQLFAFRLEDHFKRLKRSQCLLQLEDKYTIEELKEAFFEIIRANEYKQDIAVRQTLFVEGFGSWGSSESVNMFVAPIPKEKTSVEYNKKGLRCCVSSWRRINDTTLSPRIKCGANYINSRMAQREAIRNGYDTTIFLNDVGKVAEGPGSCLFIVRNNRLITPLITDSVLESITRDTIIILAKELKIEVEERTIDRTELYMCDEAFLCGSAMEITPVNVVDGYCINRGEEGEMTRQLHKKYLSVVTGIEEDKRNWLTSIY
ncbi:MAG: branched-chain amino acid transaminase [Roseburia sp.]|nr:branched-chain amino acid transaminase [Roseburia sp.]